MTEEMAFLVGPIRRMKMAKKQRNSFRSNKCKSIINGKTFFGSTYVQLSGRLMERGGIAVLVNKDLAKQIEENKRAI